jgi:hypothetical protein
MADPQTGIELHRRPSRNPEKSDPNALFAGGTDFFRRYANGNHHHDKHLRFWSNRISRRQVRHNDPLAGVEIQSTLCAKLAGPVAFCEKSLFSSDFPSLEGPERPVGRSPSRWRPRGQILSGRRDGSTSTRPASGFPVAQVFNLSLPIVAARGYPRPVAGRWSRPNQPAGGESVPALRPLQGVSSLITLAARAASVRALAGATTAAVR